MSGKTFTCRISLFRLKFVIIISSLLLLFSFLPNPFGFSFGVQPASANYEWEDSTSWHRVKTSGINGMVSIQKKTDGELLMVAIESVTGEVYQGTIPNVELLTSMDNSVSNWTGTGIFAPYGGSACLSWAEGDLYLTVCCSGNETTNSFYKIYKSTSGNGGDWQIYSTLQDILLPYIYTPSNSPAGEIKVLDSGRWLLPGPYYESAYDWWKVSRPSVFASDDNGQTWTKMVSGYYGPSDHAYYTGATSRCVVETNTGSLYWGFGYNHGSSGTMYKRSVDDGNTWVDAFHVDDVLRKNGSVMGNSMSSGVISDGQEGLYVLARDWNDIETSIVHVTTPDTTPVQKCVVDLPNLPQSLSVRQGLTLIDGKLIIIDNLFVTGGDKYVISGLGAEGSLIIRDPKDILQPTCQGDPVDTASGAMNINKSLLAVNGARPLSFDVTYNSLLLNEGPLGKGWGHNFETYLEQLIDGNVKIHWNANRENTFINDGSDNFSAAERAILFDTLVKNADGTYTLTRQDQRVYQFNVQGKLVEQKNRIGQSLTMTYDDSAGLLQTITEPVSGRYINVHHNIDGLIDQVSDPLNRIVSFSYDSEKNLTGITDALGRTTSYTYNTEGQVLTGTDADGKQYISHTYDSKGRVITQDDGLSYNQLFRFSYDEEDQPGKIVTTVTNRIGKTKVLVHNRKYQMESVKDELGNTTYYTYDTDGNCNGYTDGNGHTTSYTYDNSGNILTITDALGHVTTMTYDSKNNLKTITNNAGKVSTMEYDAMNNLTSVIDFMGNRTSYTYNFNSLMETKTMPRLGVITWTCINGLPETVTDAHGNTTTFGYDAAGRVISTTNQAGKTSYISYDNEDNILTLTDPLNRSVSFTYGCRDNKLTQTDARGYTTTFTYDANSNLKTAADPMNNITQYQYDGEDRLFRVIDARGNATTYIRDDKGRVTGITDQLGYTLSYEYDAADNLTGTWDKKGIKTSTITYDAMNNQKALTDALNRTFIKDYDNLNRLSQVTDPAGHITKFGYDNMDRLTSVIDALSGTGSQTFDADGNRNTMTDPNSNQTVFDYDLAGRLTSETSSAGNIVLMAYNNRNLPEQITNSRGQIISYTYDDASLIKTSTDPTGTVAYNYDENGNVLTVTDSSGTITREFDSLNRVKKYTDARGNIIQYSYDAVGNLKTLTYPDGRQVAYEYSTENLLKKVTDWAGRVITYDYDQNGKLVTITRQNGTTLSCSYDDAGQLLQMKDVDAHNNIISQYDLTYDSKGNVETEVPAIEQESFIMEDAAMTYTSNNRIATYNDQTIVYDSDGNMTTGPLNGQMVNFTYDARNRLTVAGSTYYQYDAEGNRISVVDGVYQDSYIINPHANLSQVLIKTDGQGNQTYYVYGLGLIGQEEPGGSYRTYHYDLRGSTIALTDENGNIIDRFQYAPYGELVNHSGNNWTQFLFNGSHGVIFDGNGIYYMRARYYSPEIRRFINQDPIVGTIADMQSLNRYSYVKNSPVLHIDPQGLWDNTVHKDRTIIWALEAGFSEDDANIIADACNEIDNSWNTNPLTHKDWHFNRANFMQVDGAPVGEDTRISHKNSEFNQATELLKNPETRTEGLKHLGWGLHPLQDIDAHMNAGVDSRFIVSKHDLHYLDKDYYDDIYWDYRDNQWVKVTNVDDNMRLSRTRDATIDYLKSARSCP
ncbi:RHS repeat-associated core domain-containing protein [Pelotomaculum propionicicum]|uniref:RHS repeat-associated core domain-containing protein n=1 Tax=Pelotomaculum propionicicum TaxID=258475 RepID=UPI003BA340AB